MPSRVGRTISDMSVHMASNPSPLKGPGYPAPDTGIFPVSAWYHSRAMMSGVQCLSPRDLNSGLEDLWINSLGHPCTHLRQLIHWLSMESTIWRESRLRLS